MQKQETEQWDSLKQHVKPVEMSDDDFAQILFWKGINAFMEELTEKVNSMSEEEKNEIMNSETETPEPVVSND